MGHKVLPIFKCFLAKCVYSFLSVKLLEDAFIKLCHLLKNGLLQKLINILTSFYIDVKIVAHW